MNQRLTNAASVACLVSFGIGLGVFGFWLAIRTEAALLKAEAVQQAQSELVKDLTDKILPAMQQQIDDNMSADAFSEP